MTFKHKKRFKLLGENWISKLLLLWVMKLVDIESFQDHDETYLKLDKGDKSLKNANLLSHHYQETKSLTKALIKAYGYKYLLISIWDLFAASFLWLSSFYLLKSLLNHAVSNSPLWQGHLWAISLFIACLLTSTCFHQVMIQSAEIGIQCRSALMVMIYRKSLSLSYCSGISDIVNLISIDCNHIAEACINLQFWWSAVFECLVVVVLACVDIGIAGLPSFFLILFILLPLQFYISKRCAVISQEVTTLVTKRVHLMSEIITAIKLIKFYAWEKYYLTKVRARRAQEIKRMKRQLMLKTINFVLLLLAPTLCAFVCILTLFYLKDVTFDAASVFALLSIFNTLRYPLLLLPLGVRSKHAATKSIKELEKFFNLPEIDSHRLLEAHAHPQDHSLFMEFKDATFVWQGDLDHPHITDLTLGLKRNNLVIVVGEIGSGKSLLACIMGQLKKTKGEVRVYPADGFLLKRRKRRKARKKTKSQLLLDANLNESIGSIPLETLIPKLTAIGKSSSIDSSADSHDKLTVDEAGYEEDDEGEANERQRGGTLDATEEDELLTKEQVNAETPEYSFGYVPQEPWLIDASIRDNVLCGKEWDEQKFSQVIRTTGLLRDMMMFPEGDLTNINNLDLSIAQRQRISLARCLYHDPDIILLEDCFSPFETKAAKTLFKDIKKYLMQERKKPIVYYTQQKLFLPESDVVLVVKNGQVIEQGNYFELKKKKVNFSTYISDYTPRDDDTEDVEATTEVRGTFPMLPPRVNMLRTAKTKRASPLATSKVITNTENDELSPRLRGGSHDGKSDQIDEYLISTLIEKCQSSILHTQQQYTNMNAPPTNFANQDAVHRTIQVNSLTVHSEFDFLVADDRESITEDERQGILNQQNIHKRAWHYYDLYLKEKSGRFLGILVISAFFIAYAVRFGSDVWLGRIVQDSTEFNTAIYAVFCGAVAVGILAAGFGFSATVLRKSISLHDRVLKAILRAPISFYDMTPIGQILSIFAKHMFVIDDFLPEGWMQLLCLGPLIIGTIIIVSFLVKWFWTTLPIYFLLLYMLVNKCAKAEEKLKSLDASNKAPLFAHLSSTLEGLFSIRLYHCERLFDTFNQNLIDAGHKALYSLMAIKSFESLYVDFVACLFIYLCALLLVLTNEGGIKAGIALSNALQLLLMLQFFVRTCFDIHGTMSSVASVVYFGNHVPHEAVGVIKDTRPDRDWPSKGEIEYRNVVLKYSRYGVSVLKSVSFAIGGGEKIGVVGKSGSGKTTLLVSLMRIAELSDGHIFIDGLDISTIGLQDLRTKIAVIPQEPVLLTGTIRTNLDPFGLRSDEEVWKSLKSVHLSVKIAEMPSKLDTPVTENGKAFTVAERQLFCIARAILMNTKIVIFDEPLVAADKETDRLIQETITENFKEQTVIILACRFSLIMEADRILVMDRGRILEFDTPLNLLNDPRSKFMKMVNNSCDVDTSKLRRLAEGKLKGGPMPVSSVYCKNGRYKKPFLFQSDTDSVSSCSMNSLSSSMPKSLENIFVYENKNMKKD